jgi:GrpB-like predicted nucleotidyltransferase (UPF0157 family)/ADP-ribose pyrophosphatase YjhB (NUDIX family)
MMTGESPSQRRYALGESIVLAPASEAWPGAFDREVSLIMDALSDVSIELHHIGSTAIPGIVAKPVIDMLGVARSVEELDARAHRLAALGYEALGEFGIVGRRYFRKNAPAGARTHQLHAYAVGSPEIQRHLDFRDYLRAFPTDAAAYATLKQELAERSGGDMRAYSEGKTDFIRGIERRAAEWRERPRTLRHTRYQAAVIREGAILLVRCAFRNGPTVWILPGGGREVDESEEACVVREVQEETCLQVRVDRLLLDTPAQPPDGTYARWRTYLCSVVEGEAAPGGGEGASAQLIDVRWVPLHDERLWPDDARLDRFLYPQLRAIGTATGIARVQTHS